jgi:uncharacterized protein DUF6624
MPATCIDCRLIGSSRSVRTILEVNGALSVVLAQMAAGSERVRTPTPCSEDGLTRFAEPRELIELARVDVANTDRLRTIIETHGWPGTSLVGEQGAHHAWLIAQHSDRQLDFQRVALTLLAAAVANGDASARDLAYLTDRVRVNEGREQLYGTQLGCAQDDRVVPFPIERPEDLDARRANVGLEPLGEYIAAWSQPGEY